MDSVKNTCIVTILEEGDFIEEGGGFDCRGYFSVGGYLFVEEEGILISRRGSYFAGGGVHFDLEEGVNIIWSWGVTYTIAGGSRRGIF